MDISIFDVIISYFFPVIWLEVGRFWLIWSNFVLTSPQPWCLEGNVTEEREGTLRRKLLRWQVFELDTARLRQRKTKSKTVTEHLVSCISLVKLFFSTLYSWRLTATRLSCTCFPAFSWNPNKSHHIFVCAQYPVFGHGKGRGPAEISFTNRWELVGPLGWEARFSRFSQERSRIYWFSGEKKITIQTSSLQFLGARRRSHPVCVLPPCWELFSSLAAVWLENGKMMDLLHIRHLCFHK